MLNNIFYNFDYHRVNVDALDSPYLTRVVFCIIYIINILTLGFLKRVYLCERVKDKIKMTKTRASLQLKNTICSEEAWKNMFLYQRRLYKYKIFYERIRIKPLYNPPSKL